MLSIRIGPDLGVYLDGSERVVLTPSQGLRLAEDLIRKSTRKMVLEEVLKPGARGSVAGRRSDR